MNFIDDSIYESGNKSRVGIWLYPARSLEKHLSFSLFFAVGGISACLCFLAKCDDRSCVDLGSGDEPFAKEQCHNDEEAYE